MNCDFIKSQVFKDTLYYRRIPMVNIDLTVPNMTGHDRVVSRFNMYYRQQAAASFNYARTQLYPQAVNSINTLYPRTSLPWLRAGSDL